MTRWSLVLAAVLVSLPVFVSGQAAVGPAVPRSATLATHERNLHALLSDENAAKLWSSGTAVTVTRLLTDLQDAQVVIEGIVAPVTPKPKPRPRPATPPVKPGREELEGAMAALHRTLEDASKKQPTVTVPAEGDAPLRRITTALTSIE